jgi:hypothetical protein
MLGFSSKRILKKGRDDQEIILNQVVGYPKR